jgi:hypothetical protein
VLFFREISYHSLPPRLMLYITWGFLWEVERIEMGGRPGTFWTPCPS